MFEKMIHLTFKHLTSDNFWNYVWPSQIIMARKASHEDIITTQWKFHNALTFFRLITVLKFHIAHEKQVALLSEYGTSKTVCDRNIPYLRICHLILPKKYFWIHFT